MSEEKQPITNCVIERRIGQINIDPELFQRMSNDGLRNLFSNFVIVRCEHMYVSDGFRMIAYSPLFKVAPLSEEPPVYVIRFKDSEDGVVMDGIETLWKADR